MTDDELESTGGDRQAGPGPTRVRWTGPEGPSWAVVEAVATVLNCEPTAIPPLGGFLDPEALDRLVERASSVTGESIRVSFVYAGVEVTVDGDGTVEARPHPDEHS
jgi:hypothetical protein